MTEPLLPTRLPNTPRRRTGTDAGGAADFIEAIADGADRDPLIEILRTVYAAGFRDGQRSRTN